MNIENLEKLPSRHFSDRDVVLSAIDLVKEFIKEKELILYGGQALDYSFKAKDGVGIYSFDVLPDFDFMSPINYEHSIELGARLKEAGFQFVGTISGIHVTTRRVRMNFLFVADITFIPRVIFEKLPFIVYDDLRVIHPDFQRMDLHSSISFPYEDAPREVILHRVDKDLKRLDILDKLYPLSGDAPELSEKISHEVSGILTGYAALALYDGEAEVSDKITFASGDGLFAIITADKEVMEQSSSSAEYYEPYLDSRPLMLVLDNVEYHYVSQKRTPYNVINGVKVVSFHHLCLYFLQKYHEIKDEQYFNAYCHLWNRDRSKEVIPTDTYGISNSLTEQIMLYEYDNMIGKVEKVQWRAPAFHFDKDDAPFWDYGPLYYRMSGEKINRDDYLKLLDFTTSIEKK